MTNTKLPAAKTFNLEHQFGCAATMTVAYFVACGLVHVARRLWRSDLPGTGKIELYTIVPYNTSNMTSDEAFVSSSFSEDWLRYADEFNPSRVDAMAMVAIAQCDANYIPTHALEATQRASAIEF